MIQLNLGLKKDGPLKVLCLGAHSDDIEIGCGGTILRLIEEYPAVTFYWVVFSAMGVRGTEAKLASDSFGGPHIDRLILKEFPDGFMPYNGAEVKAVFEELKQLVSPDLIFTHRRNDLHQDHRLLAELTWNAFRDHLILEYEIPKYDGDMGAPNAYVHLGKDLAERKVRHICDQFKTQRSKQWFSEDTFLALLRLRGIESNSPSKYAEAFYCQKMLLL